VAFAYGVRDDERTIWHQACWGKGGPQHEVHAHWRRGGLTVVACTAAVPPKEEEVPVPQGPAIIVSPGEEIPPEEEEVLAPPFHGPIRGRSPTGHPCHGLARGRGGPSPPITVPPDGRGCLVGVPPLVSSLPFFFFSKTQEIHLILFSHKHGRFVG
jgi:hypothetical protein